ncbi:MAG: DUF4136 domain-containing protein [Thermodesulfovibrionales bacterium]
MKRILLVFAAAAFLAACGGMDYTYRYDPSADFARYGTYGFMPFPENARDNELLLLKAMRYAVDQELQARGYRHSERTPDFLVALSAGTEKKVDVQQYGYVYSPGFHDSPYFFRQRRSFLHPGFDYYGPDYTDYRSGVDVYEYQVGTLAVDVVDARQKELVWRGTAKGRVNEKTLQADVPGIVARLLAGFPPPLRR